MGTDDVEMATIHSQRKHVMQTNAHTGTTINEVAEGNYRINTPLRIDSIPGGFNLSQYLIVDDEPMIFHTGWRR